MVKARTEARESEVKTVEVEIKIVPAHNGWIVDVVADKYTEDGVNGVYVFETVDALLSFIEAEYKIESPETEDKS